MTSGSAEARPAALLGLVADFESDVPLDPRALARWERLAVDQPNRVAVVLRQYHRESFERLGMLEGFELAQPTKEAASGQLLEVDAGQVLGVE